MNFVFLLLSFSGMVSAGTTADSIKATVSTASQAAFQSEITIDATTDGVSTSNFVKIVLPATAFMAGNANVATTTTVTSYVGAVKCGGFVVASCIASFAYTASSREVHLVHNTETCVTGAYSVVLKGVLLTGSMDDSTMTAQFEEADAGGAVTSSAGDDSGSYGAQMTGLTGIVFTPTAPLLEKDSTITISFTPQIAIAVGQIVTVSYPGISTKVGSTCKYGTTDASAATTVVGATTGYFAFTSTSASGTDATTLVCDKITFASAQTAAVTNGAGLAFGGSATAVVGSKFIDSIVIETTASPTAAPFSAAPASAGGSMAALVLGSFAALCLLF